MVIRNRCCMRFAPPSSTPALSVGRQNLSLAYISHEISSPVYTDFIHVMGTFPSYFEWYLAPPLPPPPLLRLNLFAFSWDSRQLSYGVVYIQFTFRGTYIRKSFVAYLRKLNHLKITILTNRISQKNIFFRHINKISHHIFINNFCGDLRDTTFKSLVRKRKERERSWVL